MRRHQNGHVPLVRVLGYQQSLGSLRLSMVVLSLEAVADTASAPKRSPNCFRIVHADFLAQLCKAPALGDDGKVDPEVDANLRQFHKDWYAQPELAFWGGCTPLVGSTSLPLDAQVWG
jgi:hypothetical protein